MGARLPSLLSPLFFCIVVVVFLLLPNEQNTQFRDSIKKTRVSGLVLTSKAL